MRVKYSRVQVIAIVILCLLPLYSLVGCANLSAPAATEKVLKLNNNLYALSLDALAVKLKEIPIEESEERRPYIKAAAILEDFKKINNRFVDAAGTLAAIDKNDAKAIADQLERINVLDGDRRTVIEPIISMLIELGVTIFSE